MPLSPSSSCRCLWLTSLLLLLASLGSVSAFAPKPTAAVIGTAPPMSPTTTLLHHNGDTSSSPSPLNNKYERQRQDWIDRSVNYYSKVMREERRRTIGQWPEEDSSHYQEEFVLLAKKHYFAIRKVKDGKLAQAESIYRKIIDELLNEEDDHCDHAQLAVTTLLLALLTKRMGDAKKTRSVFLQFFRIAVLEREQDTECACSAKVLQAYALFEMQQGNSLKSVELVQKALDFDKTLAPVLKWKQFREAQRQQQLLQYRSSSLRHATESSSSP